MSIKKLSLNLKGKEELAKKVKDRFIKKSSGRSSDGAFERKKWGTSQGRNSSIPDLSKQEDLERIKALQVHQKQAEVEEDNTKKDIQENTGNIRGARILKPEKTEGKKQKHLGSVSKVAANTKNHSDLGKLSSEKSSLDYEKTYLKSSINQDPMRHSEPASGLSAKSNSPDGDRESSGNRSQLPYAQSSARYNAKSTFVNRKSTFSQKIKKRRKPEPLNAKRGTLITIDKKFITARDLSVILSEPKKRVLRCLRELGEAPDEDIFLKKDVIDLLAAELGHTIKYKFSSAEELIDKGKGKFSDADLKERPPVVTIMGHIDHGKTTLLDAFRGSRVVAAESGGITQHIGAYQMTSKSGKLITFIDTPGHAAFTAMRMRGAKVTDVVILIVAADDGVNEQTIEAIKHAKAARVPMIVAINKIDKNTANPQKVMSSLIQHDVIVEDMGGDIASVEISAKNHINLDKLEDAILLQAELLELKCNPKKNPEGVVVESRLDKRCGVFATLLVQDGQLQAGQFVIVGQTYGKIRGMTDSTGKKVKVAPAGMPVEVIGLNSAPAPGSQFSVVKSEKDAKAILEERARNKSEEKTAAKNYFEDEKKQLNLIVKADVNGSVEAIAELIKSIIEKDDADDEVEVKIVHSGVGDVTESDAMLAQVSDAYIIGFGVKVDRKIKDNKKISTYSIIYDAIEGVKSLIQKMLTPDAQENSLGIAQVKEIFVLSNKARVAGCYVKSGLMQKGAKVKVLRNSEVIKESSIKALRYFKEEAKQVKADHECGILLSDFQEIEVGDVIEAFEIIQSAK